MLKEALRTFPTVTAINVYKTVECEGYDWRKDTTYSYRKKVAIVSRMYLSPQFVDEYTYKLLSDNEGADKLIKAIQDMIYDRFGIVDAEFGVHFDFVSK